MKAQKNIFVQVKGTGQTRKLQVSPTDTSQDLLNRANLGGYYLAFDSELGPLGVFERPYDLLKDGDILEAASVPEFG